MTVNEAEGTELTGRIVTASFETGEKWPCGADDCECPDHDSPAPEPGTYITIRLDADAAVGLWDVTVRRKPSSTATAEGEDDVLRKAALAMLDQLGGTPDELEQMHLDAARAALGVLRTEVTSRP